ncbi:MAG: SDR family oxidoreductase [Deltaproteobacteria bacterium]|nr:SDR family oxidoreductase [Deltaproteobacteria bacterium]
MNTKIALVTGASRGLGKNAALKLASKGIDLVLTYHSNQKAAEQVVNEIKKIGAKAFALPLDVSQTSSFQNFANQLKELLQKEWGVSSINFLINNAGSGVHALYAQTTEEQFDQMMKEHLKAPFFLSQTLLPLIAQGGRIINISSGLARFSLPGYAAYAVMKAGVEALTRYMAKELGQRGIAVNTVAPGAIETDFGGGAVRDNQEVNHFVASQTALGRAGVPDDIGGLIAVLCTEDCRWINGQRIEASGGMFL